jgi:hypothetical protein
VLSIIPADGEEFAVLAEPNSLAAEAYRGLAAMAIATDRLPKAMMVSTPTGEAHAQVAANLAAALSRLGLKVALMAMSVEQDWYRGVPARAQRHDARPSVPARTPARCPPVGATSCPPPTSRRTS